MMMRIADGKIGLERLLLHLTQPGFVASIARPRRPPTCQLMRPAYRLGGAISTAELASLDAVGSERGRAMNRRAPAVREIPVPAMVARCMQKLPEQALPGWRPRSRCAAAAGACACTRRRRSCAPSAPASSSGRTASGRCRRSAPTRTWRAARIRRPGYETRRNGVNVSFEKINGANRFLLQTMTRQHLYSAIIASAEREGIEIVTRSEAVGARPEGRAGARRRAEPRRRTW